MRLELRRGRVEDKVEEKESATGLVVPVGNAWNTFIGRLLLAKRAWESYERQVDALGLEEVEDFSVGLQNVIANYREQKFEIMLPRFVDYWRGAGGLEEMKLSKEDILEEV